LRGGQEIGVRIGEENYIEAMPKVGGDQGRTGVVVKGKS